MSNPHDPKRVQDVAPVGPWRVLGAHRGGQKGLYGPSKALGFRRKSLFKGHQAAIHEKPSWIPGAGATPLRSAG